MSEERLADYDIRLIHKRKGHAINYNLDYKLIEKTKENILKGKQQILINCKEVK